MAEVVGWRLVKDKHAKTAFSGEGARLFEGRWNSAGVAMVYCSQHLSLAALEILVHTQPVFMRDRFRAFRVAWDESVMTTLSLTKLPKGWNAQPPGPVSKKIGDDWIQTGKFAVLAVPSVIVPFEQNFLLNPKDRDFGKIKIRDAGAFVLDARLKATTRG
jgi:RES domain-containing protein